MLQIIMYQLMNKITHYQIKKLNYYLRFFVNFFFFFILILNINIIIKIMYLKYKYILLNNSNNVKTKLFSKITLLML